MKSSRIGFVGVGRMGANMARRLHEIGYPVVAIYDANAEIAEKLAQELGSNAVGNVSEVSRLSRGHLHCRYRRRGDEGDLPGTG